MAVPRKLMLKLTLSSPNMLFVSCFITLRLAKSNLMMWVKGSFCLIHPAEMISFASLKIFCGKVSSPLFKFVGSGVVGKIL